MMFRGVLERFDKQGPITVMANLSLARVPGAQGVNGHFQHEDARYTTRDVLFSTTGDAMSLVAPEPSPKVIKRAR